MVDLLVCDFVWLVFILVVSGVLAGLVWSVGGCLVRRLARVFGGWLGALLGGAEIEVKELFSKSYR